MQYVICILHPKHLWVYNLQYNEVLTQIYLYHGGTLQNSIVMYIHFK